MVSRRCMHKKVLIDYGLQGTLSCVHLLPFCPYTSDDGFSVVDYLAVDGFGGSILESSADPLI